MRRTFTSILQIGSVLFFCACAEPADTARTGGTLPEFDFVAPDDSLEATSLIGTPLFRTAINGERGDQMRNQLEDARILLESNPSSIDGFIWYGRRLAYLGRYRDAIEVYTKGLEQFPNEPHLLRHRGHRFISTRRISEAIEDFTTATEAVAGQADEVEPDGQPNAAGLPTSTLQTNIWYHLGLAYYLRAEFDHAADAFKVCFDLAANNDMRVAAADWLYMALRRGGHGDEAENAIAFVHEDLELLENHSYLKRLLMYRGLSDDAGFKDSLGDGADALSIATLGYGVGNWHLMEGDETGAIQVFEAVLETSSWAAFGFIASEAELARRSDSAH